MAPVLPRPVCSSSRMSSIPRAWQRRCSSASQPSGGSTTPPALKIGSVMTAAGTAGGLGVDQLEARIQAGEFAVGEGLAQGTAVAVGRDHRHRAGHGRPIAGVPAGVGQRARRIRHAVEADVRARDLEAAGVLARDVDRGLVGVGARLQEQALLERGRHDRGQALGQLHLFVVEVARVGVDQGVAGLRDGRRDRGLVVAEPGAHLAAVEVEVALAVDILDFAAGAPHEDRPLEAALVHARAKAVAARGLEDALLGCPRGRVAGFRRDRHGIPPPVVAGVPSAYRISPPFRRRPSQRLPEVRVRDGPQRRRPLLQRPAAQLPLSDIGSARSRSPCRDR